MANSRPQGYITYHGDHKKCRVCKRLLIPMNNGKLPPHRIPPERKYDGKNVPLTGQDRPWCSGGDSHRF